MPMPTSLKLSLSLPLLLTLFSVTLAAESDWIQLSAGKPGESWQEGTDTWTLASNAKLDAENDHHLVEVPGDGVLISSLTEIAELRNLTSSEHFADLEVHVEFLIPKGSNAGVKLMGLYEIQIIDSFGKKKPQGNDCGGIYPRAELKPRYHTIDAGFPPAVNAARPAGQWQEVDILFRAPRFDASGKKTENARFVKVTMNGQIIHSQIEVPSPTGHAYLKEQEVTRGPLFLQGDHGPVAYRNVRVRPAIID